MTVDATLFRQVAGSFASGVTIVTTGLEGGYRGFTASSFSSLSLDPPLVLVCIDRKALTLPVLQETGAFAINILGHGCEELSRRFSTRSVPDHERMLGVSHRVGETGVPLLEGALAYFECRLWQQYDGGDHVIATGEVVDAGVAHDAEPLLYYRGSYRRILDAAARAS